jgi:hypothetical protein
MLTSMAANRSGAQGPLKAQGELSMWTQPAKQLPPTPSAGVSPPAGSDPTVCPVSVLWKSGGRPGQPSASRRLAGYFGPTCRTRLAGEEDCNATTATHLAEMRVFDVLPVSDKTHQGLTLISAEPSVPRRIGLCGVHGLNACQLRCRSCGFSGATV